MFPLERQELPSLARPDQHLKGEWYAACLATFVERDVRHVRDIGKLTDFHLLVRLLAARASQERNISSLARELGVSSHTIDRRPPVWTVLCENLVIAELCKQAIHNGLDQNSGSIVTMPALKWT